MKEVVAYSDGACRGNPGPGGWGVWLRWNGHEKEICGGEPMTTNNRMELTAAIMALESIHDACLVLLHTDSTYVMQGLSHWLPGWKKNGWRTADRKPVKNQELWQRLDAAAQRHQVQWRWVKGHSGDVGNERADLLANRGLDEMLRRPVATIKSAVASDVVAT